MLFLSAQPDDFYFLWQLELQIHNFRSLGISPEQIHILVGYDKNKGLAHYFSAFFEKYHNEACFFAYEDKRYSKHYIPSIRTNIIKQHFEQFPALEKENIFYHDSDVLFRVLPEFDKLNRDDKWYLSDTRAYISSKYIVNTTSEDILTSMCKIVGISKDLVVANDDNAGGAQYLMKNVDWKFWDKVEKDSEELYKTLLLHTYKRAETEYIADRKLRTDCKSIQSWCADMWALLWNAWLLGYKTEIAEQLGFSWATNTIDKWYFHNMLHYTGGVKKEDLRNFQKNRYVKFVPYYDPALDKLLPVNCGYVIKEAIISLKKQKEKDRIQYTDLHFVIIYEEKGRNSLKELETSLRFLAKEYSNSVTIVETGSEASVPRGMYFESGANYILYNVSASTAERTIVEKYLLYQMKEERMIFIDHNIILDEASVTWLLFEIKNSNKPVHLNNTVVFGSVINQIFSKLLDPHFFVANRGKGRKVTSSKTQCVAANKQDLIHTGALSKILCRKDVGQFETCSDMPIYRIDVPV